MEQKKTSTWATREEIVQLLEDFNALRNLDALVCKGCDRSQILTKLQLLRTPPLKDTWEAATGVQNPKELEQIARQVEGCADSIERTNSGWYLTFLRATVFRQLPALLRSYAMQLRLLRKWFGPKRHPTENIAKCQLVEHVHAATGEWRDEGVSSLIAAVLDNQNYDAGRHGRWRRENCREILESGRSRKAAVLPPPPTLTENP